MGIVTSVVGNVDALGKDVALDTLALTSVQRACAHFTARTSSGAKIRVSLERGSELNDGDVLKVADGVAIVVVAATEDLLLLRPGDDPMMWWVSCYQLGNLHRPARFSSDGILTPYDPMALNVLRGFGAVIEHVNRPFVGKRFGAVRSHHDHDHGHHQVPASGLHHHDDTHG